MVNRHTSLKIRKMHRYLGLFLGIQFLFWTLSGIYFSWTNIDDIHGDNFRKPHAHKEADPSKLFPVSDLNLQQYIHSLELTHIGDQPYYWVNDNSLFDAVTGTPASEIDQGQLEQILDEHLLPGYQVASMTRIEQVGPHHEYREKPLPAWEVSFDQPEGVKAYINVKNGKFQAIRSRDWRWFDFLWMTHTMDYESRDNFNNTLLRIFSVLGLITVLSGFLLWWVSSPRVRKLFAPAGQGAASKIARSV